MVHHKHSCSFDYGNSWQEDERHVTRPEMSYIKSYFVKAIAYGPLESRKEWMPWTFEREAEKARDLSSRDFCDPVQLRSEGNRLPFSNSDILPLPIEFSWSSNCLSKIPFFSRISNTLTNFFSQFVSCNQKLVRKTQTKR